MIRIGFAKRVQSLIAQSDLVLEVLDARFPELTRNRETEERVARQGKRLVLVLNKADLVSKETAKMKKKELAKELPCVFLSANQKNGTAILRKVVFKALGKKGGKVAVVGYPNTGKSSVINALAGRKAARTSAQAGFTRGEQLVRISEKVLLIDSPGVIPFEERDEAELALVAAKNPNQLKDIEGAAERIIEWMLQQNPEAIRKNFGVEAGSDASETLERIALAKKRLRKGGEADTRAMAMQLVLDWQKGKVKA